MMTFRQLIAGTLLLTGIRAESQTMLDPAIDATDRPWCFLAKSTSVIGVPYMPDVTQVTFDGALYTGSAELCFFYGNPLQPLLARQKHWLDGWLPIVQYAWTEGAIGYDIEMFSAILEGERANNTLQLVKFSMHNRSPQPVAGQIAAAMRCRADDHRYGRNQAAPGWRYAMEDGAAYRQGQLVYTFSPDARCQAVTGRDYDKPFTGAQVGIRTQTATCLARYARVLQPHESFSAVFRMPRVPVPDTNGALLKKIRHADYAEYRRRTEAYWRSLFAAGSEFEIPEPRVNQALRASLVHLMLATRSRGGERFQTSGLPYPNFFLIDFVDMRMAYDAMGQPEFARENFDDIFARQMPDGLFCDTSLSHGKRLWSSHGHMIHSLAHHCLMTRDWELARSIYPHLKRAIEWIEQARKEDEYGLMPPAWPYDAEMIKGRYTGHNLWSLLGLRSAIRLARQLEEQDDVEAWTTLHDAYERDVLKAIDASARADGYVPTGLYDFVTGPASRPGFAEFRTDQDWENLVLSYPTEVLTPGNPRVAGTVARMHRLKYREGIMTYRNGMHLHQYLTTNVTNQHIVRGEQRQALTDLYHILLHCGSTYEGFENMVAPWTRILARVPPPHAWAAAKITLLIRNMLVLEQGGRAGLDNDQRDLWLFSVISPAWAQPGQQLALRQARTEFGPVNAAMTFTDTGASLRLDNHFHTAPRSLIVRVPYFVELHKYETDASEAIRDGDVIRLSPDATRLTMTWGLKHGIHDHTFQDLLLTYRREVGHWKGKLAEHPPVPEGFLTPAEAKHGPVPLSFDAVLAAYRHEYQRRFDALVAGGGKILRVHAPPLAASLPSPVDPAVHGIAIGKPVTASAALAKYRPELAVDGIADDLQSSWQTDPYPAWLQIDLETTCTIDRIHVFPYWGQGRYYRYTVEVSANGRQWRQVADLSANTQPATAAGDDHRFAAVSARYVRVNMLYHNLNRGVHLVEVRVFGRAQQQ